MTCLQFTPLQELLSNFCSWFVAYNAWMKDNGGVIVNIIADMWKGFPGMAWVGKKYWLIKILCIITLHLMAVSIFLSSHGNAFCLLSKLCLNCQTCLWQAHRSGPSCSGQPDQEPGHWVGWQWHPGQLCGAG